MQFKPYIPTATLTAWRQLEQRETSNPINHMYLILSELL